MKKFERGILETPCQAKPQFHWSLFGFLSVTVITIGCTLSSIYAPDEPRAPFDPVRHCLTTNTYGARCDAFFKSGLADRPYPIEATPVIGNEEISE